MPREKLDFDGNYVGRNAIIIRIPSLLSRQERLRQLTKRKEWAQEPLERNVDRFKAKTSKEYKDGDFVSSNGKKYRLVIHNKERKTSSVSITGISINLTIPLNLTKKKRSRTISILIRRCIGKTNLFKLKETISYLNKMHFNRPVNNIRFKYTNSSWGSCSKKGNINISTRLLLAPEDILEYVCIHELAHLVEYNHSRRFWFLVEKAMPDYKEKRDWLRINGHKCVF
jgi:predicted metal-dependent hydrolase